MKVGYMSANEWEAAVLTGRESFNTHFHSLTTKLAKQ